MSATNAFETALLQHIFQNADVANVGDAGGLQNSAAAGVFYISLHTGDPGETGAQNTSEANYSGYARVSVARTGSEWAVTGDTADNVNAIVFGACVSGSSSCTHFGIGSDSSGTGNLFFSGALGATLSVSAGITPSFAAGTLDVTAQ
ncbi:MAG TPA: hypothetical protein VNU68_07565 [Verrucomicrobiae bacterium]|nr:hypothetical protein [Verrucomicrobiae bacterium]